jgi:polar amino acid transport system substrate-binding protein
LIRDFLQAARHDLVSTGRLRAAVSLANAMVVHRAANDEPCGPAPQIAQQVARRLEAPLELIAFDTVAGIIDSVGGDRSDIAFLTFDPDRVRQLDFSLPYAVHESSYLVRAESRLRTALDFARPGVRIAVGRRGLFDLHLGRTLKSASLRRVSSAAEAVALMDACEVDAIAGVREPLQAMAAAHGGLRLIEGRFAAVTQAIAVPKGRGAGMRYLNAVLRQIDARPV